MVVESHCLQLQNAGKHIPATIEFQNFPGEHAPRPPLGARPSGPCQFFARVSNSIALLFKTLMNPLHTLAPQYGSQNYFLLISCQTFDSSAQICCKRYHIIFPTSSLKFKWKACVQKEVIHNFKNNIFVT